MTLHNYRQEINPHKSHNDDKLGQIFEVARANNAQIYSLVKLLHTCALRIQDAVGLTFGQVTQLKVNKSGFRKLKLVGKKTTGRTVLVDQHTFEAILAYQQEIEAEDEDEMFPPGDGHDPANKWVKKLKRFSS